MRRTSFTKMERPTVRPYRINEIKLELEIEGDIFDVNNPKHISNLVRILKIYDEGLEETLSSGEPQFDYVNRFEFLEDFANVFPNLDYQRFLSKKDSDNLAYFYSDTILFYLYNERERVAKIMNWK